MWVGLDVGVCACFRVLMLVCLFVCLCVCVCVCVRARAFEGIDVSVLLGEFVYVFQYSDISVGA
jgi:hypothetical protein